VSRAPLWQRTEGNGQGSQPAGPTGQPLICLRQVVKTYHSAAGDFEALRGIDLTVQRGEFAAIVGRSGSGKSTLINMVAGMDHPTSGEVWVNGTAVHRLSESELSPWRGRQLGVIFQFFQLLPTLTLLQNVMLPMDLCRTYPLAERRRRGMALLEQVGLAALAHKIPSAVSGGHQQLAAIARALANDPPLLLADEPTGNLDSGTAESIIRLFDTLVARGKTILLVTHDRDMVRRQARCIQVVDGRIVDGAHSAAREPAPAVAGDQ
jgi:putative ABC transport system ATP-binding protein